MMNTYKRKSIPFHNKNGIITISQHLRDVYLMIAIKNYFGIGNIVLNKKRDEIY